MITIAELFPRYTKACKWLGVFRVVTPQETVRLEKEYTFHTKNEDREEWKIDRNLHRTDGPALIEYNVLGGVYKEEWWYNGMLHRKNGPAIIEYYPSGKIIREKWYFYDICHRDGVGKKPFELWLYSSSSVNNTQKDRPAHVHYYEDGRVSKEEWWINGRLHRDSGPAEIDYIEDRCVWYDHGFCTNHTVFPSKR